MRLFIAEKPSVAKAIAAELGISGKEGEKVKSELLTATLALCMTGLLSSCQKEPPKCSDEETLGLVRQIILQQIDAPKSMSEAEAKNCLKFEFSRASAYDKKIKKYSCDAKLIAGGTYEVPIKYESQLDDKKQHLVAVNGMSGEELWNIKLAIDTRNSKGAKEDAGSTSPKVQIPGNVGKPDITGTWSRLEGGIEMEIRKATSSSEFDVSLTVSRGPCVGSLEGGGTLSGDVLIVLPNGDDLNENEKDPCRISVKFTGHTAQVEESNCLKWHGYECGFSGPLTKVNKPSGGNDLKNSITATPSKMNNASDGFNGIEWGTKIERIEGLVYEPVYDDVDRNLKTYHKVLNGNMLVGAVQLYEIQYIANNGVLVAGGGKYECNEYDEIKKELTNRYGKGEILIRLKTPSLPPSLMTWKGAKTTVDLHKLGTELCAVNYFSTDYLNGPGKGKLGFH